MPNIQKEITPKNIMLTPAVGDRYLLVHIVRIWLDFYEDDMWPWALSSIHILRYYAIPSGNLPRN
jgi:hypothetical protein